MKNLILVACAVALVACEKNNPDFFAEAGVGGAPGFGGDPGQGGNAPGDAGGEDAAGGAPAVDLGPAPVDEGLPPPDAAPDGGDPGEDAGPTPDMGPADPDEDQDGVPASRDCDDADPNRFPGNDERCNGADEDCDFRADEDFPGLRDACEVGAGACRARGVKRCAEDGGAVVCGAMEGAPGDEACNQIDDDCDGVVDEDAPDCCEPGRARDCGTDEGVCEQGAQRCDDAGRWGPCLGGVQLPAEACNGRDDDCDGRNDEGVLNACGQCGDVPAEDCNGADDDCDGEVDEGALNACGRCGEVPGEVCNQGDDDCDGEIDEGLECGGCEGGRPEVCDGEDDDCDERIDEGVLNACGRCGPVPAEVCNAEDDDCDGTTDEGALNACGRCGAVPAEVCNGGDDDCDGRTDEGVQNACGDCGAVPVEVCNGRDDDCDGQTDEGFRPDCEDCAEPRDEACNGADDDCDGQIDEGVANACGRCGPLPDEVCNGGDDDCDGTIDEGLLNACGDCGPTPIEVCNGQDDDCDGTTDEGVGNPCGGCGPAPIEQCNGEDDDCDGETDEGVRNACGECGPTPAEACNGVDDDCDGQVDEAQVRLCVVYRGQTPEAPSDGELGRAVVSVGDLNGDGVPDAMAGAPGRSEVWAISGANGARLWRVERDDDDLGAALAVADFDGDGAAEVVAGAPGQFTDRAFGRLVFIDRDGSVMRTYNAQPGQAIGGALAGGAFGEVGGVVLGDPTRRVGVDGFIMPQGAVFALGFANNGGFRQIFERIGGDGARFGEAVHTIPDVTGDGFQEVIATFRNDGDRRTVLLDGRSGAPDGVLVPPLDTDNTFGQAVVWGRLGAGGGFRYAFGAHGARIQGQRRAGTVFLVGADGTIWPQRVDGSQRDEERGRALTVAYRPDWLRDVLVVAGATDGRVVFYHPDDAFSTSLNPADAGSSFGFAVAATVSAAPDGTRRRFAVAPGDGVGRGRVWVYSIR